MVKPDIAVTRPGHLLPVRVVPVFFDPCSFLWTRTVGAATFLVHVYRPRSTAYHCYVWRGAPRWVWAAGALKSTSPTVQKHV
jgi:hypothetical protein